MCWDTAESATQQRAQISPRDQMRSASTIIFVLYQCQTDIITVGRQAPLKPGLANFPQPVAHRKSNCDVGDHGNRESRRLQPFKSSLHRSNIWVCPLDAEQGTVGDEAQDCQGPAEDWDEPFPRQDSNAIRKKHLQC